MPHSENSDGSTETREEMIREITEASSVSRQEAEAIAAIELGESDGDLIDMDQVIESDQ